MERTGVVEGGRFGKNSQRCNEGRPWQEPLPNVQLETVFFNLLSRLQVTWKTFKGRTMWWLE